MTARLLSLLALAACASDAEVDTSTPADTGSADTAAGDTAETGSDTGEDTGTDTDTGEDTAEDTADTDTGADSVCTSTPSVMLYDPASASWVDFTASIPGAAPAVKLTLNQSGGEIRFCGGTWYTYMSAEADVTISGAYGAVVNAGGYATGLTVATDGIAVTVRDVTLTGGLATTPVRAGGYGGGSILCERDGVALALDGVTITGNQSSTYGGGLYIDGCAVTMDSVAITNNTAAAGAGLFVMSTVLTQITIRESTIASNAASLSGGGLYVTTSQADATVSLVDTLVSGNTAVGGGGGLTFADGAIAGMTGTVTCSGGGAQRGAFVGNTAANASLPGGAVYLISWWGNPVAFSAVDCDFGASGSGEDNAPADVFVYGDSSYTYGDGATFSCDGSGCI